MVMDDDDDLGQESEECSVSCPFCGTVVLTAWTYSYEPVDVEACSHLVAMHSWGCGAYEDPWIDEAKHETLKSIFESLSKKADREIECLHDLFSATIFREDGRLRFELEDWTVATSSVYVEAGLGPQGGGPTYIGVFLAPHASAK